MRDARLKDFKIKKVEKVVEVKKKKFKPLFLGMKKKDMHRIVYNRDRTGIIGRDERWNRIYEEYEHKNWTLWKYNKNNKVTYSKDSKWRVVKNKYDRRGNYTCCNDGSLYSRIRTYDNNDNEIFFENASWRKLIQEYNKQNTRIYWENERWERCKTIGEKTISHIDWVYYIDGQEAEFISDIK